MSYLLNVDVFFINFWANFLAGICVAGLFSVVFVRLFEYYRKPKLKLIYIKEFHQNFDWISIRIRNNGKMSLKKGDINWHLYIPQELNFDFLEKDKYPNELAGPSNIIGKMYNHYRDFNFFPSFPEREITILRLKLNNIRGRKFRIFYHFSSAVGMQPRRIWKKFWYRKIAKRNGDIKLEVLPYIEINYS